MGTPTLALETSATPDGLVVAATGEIDASTADTLLDSVTELVESGPSTVDLDFAGVTFLGSTGIACLVLLHRRATAADCVLTLRNVNPHITRVLRIAGIAPLIGLPPAQPR